MISTHTKKHTENHTHEVKVNKQARCRSRSNANLAKRRRKSREKDKKQYLPSSSSQIPAPRLPASPLPTDYFCTRTRADPPELLRVRERES